MTIKNIYILVIIFLIVAGAILVLKKYYFHVPDIGVMCTADAKICPDGSYVGRIAPDCLFATCPDIKKENTTIIKTETGVLTGQITLSPVCPVERDPPDPKCAPQPYSVLLDVVSASNGKFSLQVHTDANGIFLMNLPVGVYTLIPRIEMLYPRCDLKKATVALGATTTANISCDSGIR